MRAKVRKCGRKAPNVEPACCRGVRLCSLTGRQAFGSNVVLRSLRIAFEAGAFIGLSSAYSLGNKFSLSADVQYSQKGYRLLGYDAAPEYRYTYIDFIPEVEYRLFKPVSLSLGFNYAFLTRQVSKSGNDNWSAVREEEAILTTDFGLSAKVQAHFGHFYGFLRYNHGLKDLSNTTNPVTQDGGAKRPVLHNNNLQLGLGYAF